MVSIDLLISFEQCLVGVHFYQQLLSNLFDVLKNFIYLSFQALDQSFWIRDSLIEFRIDKVKDIRTHWLDFGVPLLFGQKLLETQDSRFIESSHIRLSTLYQLHSRYF